MRSASVDLRDVVASLRDGAVIVRAVNAPDGGRATDIIAIALDADGRPRGSARRLRRTTGPVVAIDASAAGDRLHIAWIAARHVSGDDDARREFIVAAMRASTDLATIDAPVTLDDFRAILGDEGEMAPQALTEPEVRVAAMPDGGARIIAPAPVRTCVHEAGTDHASRIPCRGWALHALSADGRHTRSGDGVVAMNRGPYGLVAVPGGAVFAVDSEHIGYKSAVIPVTASVDGGAPPFGDLYWHYRDLSFAAVGGAVFARAFPTEQGMAESRDGHIIALTYAHAARTPVIHGESGDEWPEITSRRLRCRGATPVIELQWHGGSVTLDPTQPGTSFRWEDWLTPRHLEPVPDVGEESARAAFAGRAIVSAHHRFVDAYRCAAGGSLVRSRYELP